MIYNYVTVCRFCAVRCLIIICFSLLFLITYVCNILVMFVYLFCMFVFYFVYSVFLYCFVYCFTFVYSCLIPNIVQVYRPMPTVGNPTAVNKYHITQPARSIVTTPTALSRLKMCLISSNTFISWQ